MLNKVQIIGRLGKDPELKYMQNGAGVCTFSVATSERWTDQNGQQQEKTEWHNVSVWNRGQSKLAEACAKYLAKGKLAYVEGSLETRTWNDQQTGEKKYATGIKATHVTFLSPADGQGQAQENHAPQQGQARQQQNGQGRPAQRQQYRPPSQQLESMSFPDEEPSAPPSMMNTNFDYENIPF